MKQKNSLSTKNLRFFKVFMSLMFLLTIIANTNKIQAATIAVEILESDSVSDIEAKFNLAMDDAEANDRIVVSGKKTNADSMLWLAAPKKVIVEWKVTYASSERVVFDGIGTLEIVSGSSITCSTGDAALQGSNATTIVISGGTVRSQDANSVTIYCSDKSKLEVKSGTVENTAGVTAIEGRVGSEIVISGGTVRSNNYSTNGTITVYSKLEIKGGTVENLSNSYGYAISGMASSSVTISGGTIKNNCSNDTVLRIYGNLTIKGGISKVPKIQKLPLSA